MALPTKPPAPASRAMPKLLVWLALVASLLTAATVLHCGADSEHARSSSGSVQAAASELRVSGGAGVGAFVLRVEGQSPRAVQLDGVPFRDQGAAVGGGIEVRDKDDGFVLTRGAEQLRFKAKDEAGYSIRDGADAVLFRVKVKEDKFNVYDGTGRRVLYGKEKKSQIQLRDDAGTTIGAISGTTNLALAAILAVPIPPEMRAAAFTHGVERLMP